MNFITTRAACFALALCLSLASPVAFAGAAPAGREPSSGRQSTQGREPSTGWQTTAVVNNPNPQDRLNLRAEPRISAASLGKYYSGVSVTVYGIPGNGQGEWTYVSIGDGQRGSISGYMQTKYLVWGGGSVRSAMPTYTAHSSAWELYDSASLRATYRMQGAGVTVEVLGVLGTWQHVRVQGQYGYVPEGKSGQPVPNPIGTTANVNNPNPGDRLHLRTAPNAGATSLGKYFNGVTVEILSYTSDTWCKVRIGNTEGYMMRKYLTSATVRSVTPTMTVINPNPNDRLNLRYSMSVKSDSLGKFSNGTKVEVLGIGDTWYHVRVNGTIGYMMKQYLK